MKTKVRLFLNDQELEFTGEPSVLYNFNLDSVVNPTAIKNNYTKTVQVEGTPRNNKIFGEIWDLTRIQSDGDFNPSKRTPFDLYIDGELYETGYVKLNNVNRTHNKIVYNITLYGGIGDFLYNLSYRDDGEQLRLSDLAYLITGGTSGNPTSELDFKINIHSVYSAWTRLGTHGAMGMPMFDVINFAPAYNGYPGDGFDADKVLINANAGGFTGETRINSAGTITTYNGFPTAITIDNQTYQTLEGYGYGEINGKMTEWEMRDLRSYMQRPVLRMKAFINACCDPTQNGGYEVELDSDFFNTGNTYYENAWMTLPMLNDLKYDDETVDAWSGHCDYWVRITGGASQFRLAEDTTRGSNTSAIEVTIRPHVTIPSSHNPPTNKPLYCAAMVNNADPQWNANAWVFQLIGKDYSGNVVAGSDIFSLTSDVNGKYLNIPLETGYQPAWAGGSIYNTLGYFTYYGTGTDPDWGSETKVYEWNSDVTLRMNTSGQKIKEVWLYMSNVANLTYGTSSISGEQYRTYGYRQGKLYTATTLTSLQDRTNYWGSSIQRFGNVEGNVYYANGASVNSNAKITKQTLLSLDGSPCQYLVGYLKTFGLYLRKDPLQKKIQVLTRPNYYSGSTIENWDERIDHTKQIQVTPLTFKHKWYSFNYTQKDKSATEDKYYDKYGTNYGTEKVNTGYNFDSETEDLLKGIIYNNAVDCLEKSPYFVDRYVDGVNNYPPMLYSWIKYVLMKSSSDETGSVDIASTFNYTDIDYGTYGEMYDQFPKVQLRNNENEALDGVGVLLFYNGTVTTYDANNSAVTFHLSDDVSEMFEYGDNPCWLYTQGIFNTKGQQIVWYYTGLPHFARNVYDNSYITESWDFGKTKELYTPYTYYNDTSNIYDRWWKSYINDLYDVNTRVVEAYVKLPKTQGDILLRKFYWFDNAIWRINKISDWNICGEQTTKVEFIKVQSVTNYTDKIQPIVPTAESFTATCTMYPEIIPASGGVVTFTVNSNMTWNGGGGSYNWLTFSNNYTVGTNPSGVTTFTATASTSPYEYDRDFSVVLVGENDERKFFNFSQRSPYYAYLEIDPERIDFSGVGGSAVVTLTYHGYDAGGNWIVDTDEGQDWQSRGEITQSATGDYWTAYTCTISAATNDDSARNTYYQFEKNGYVVSVGLYQAAPRMHSNELKYIYKNDSPNLEMLPTATTDSSTWGANITGNTTTYWESADNKYFHETTLFFDGPVTKIGITMSSLFASSAGTLYHFEMPDTVTGMTESCFAYKQALKSVVLSDSLTSITHGTFNGCTGLTTFNWPASLSHIGQSAFTSTNLSRVVIPDAVYYIGAYAFSNVPITALTLPNSLEWVSPHTFDYTSGMTYVEIPDSVRYVGEYGFRQGNSSNVRTLVIGSGLTYVEPYGFYRMSSLELIYAYPTTPPTLYNYAFRYAATGGTLYCPVGSDYSTWITGGNTTYLGGTWTIVSVGNAIWFGASVTDIDRHSSDLSGVNTIYAYRTTAPSVSDSTFFYVANSGTLHYKSGSDYSSWISKLPASWTSVDDL